MAKNKIQDLRDHLFETIEMLKDGDMEIDKARAIAEVAQVIVNSAKIEVDYIKAIDAMNGTGFIQADNGAKPISNT